MSGNKVENKKKTNNRSAFFCSTCVSSFHRFIKLLYKSKINVSYVIRMGLTNPNCAGVDGPIQFKGKEE